MAELETHAARRHRDRAAWLVSWLLAGCIHGPTLNLGASSSFRAREGQSLRSQGFWAGAQLGWSAGTRARRLAGDEPEPLAGAAVEPSGAPCAFDLTCRWEHEQRAAAFARTAEIAPAEGASP